MSRRKMNRPQKNYWECKAYIKKDQCDLINLYCEQNGYKYPDLARAMGMNCKVMKNFLICNNSLMKCQWSTYDKIGGFIADKRLVQRRIDFLGGDDMALVDTADNLIKYDVVGGAVTSVEEVEKHLQGIGKDIELHGYCTLDWERVTALKYYCDKHRISRMELMYDLRLTYPTIKRFWDGCMRVSYATYQAVTKYMDEHGIYAQNDTLE